MKRIILLLFTVAGLSNCSVKEKTFSGFTTGSLIELNPDDLYFIRLCSKDTVVNEYEPSIKDTIQSELPLVTYVNCATYRDARMFTRDSSIIKINANEEVYLYLHGFGGQLESGEASYLITEKFKKQSSRTRYYANPRRLYLDKIKKIRIGNWSKIIDGEYTEGLIQLKFIDGKKTYMLKARVNEQGQSINIVKMTNPSLDELGRSNKKTNTITVNDVLGFREEGFPMYLASPQRQAVLKTGGKYIAAKSLYLDTENEKLYFLTGDNTGYEYRGTVEAVNFLKDFERQLIQNY